MASRRRDKLLKSIGLAQKLFSPAQYSAAKRRLREREDGSIGDELVRSGALTRAQLRGLWRAVDYRLGREEDKNLARVMVDSGYADRKQVDRALEKQKGYYSKTGHLARLGQILVDDGVIVSSQLRAALKIHGIEKGDGPEAPAVG